MSAIWAGFLCLTWAHLDDVHVWRGGGRGGRGGGAEGGQSHRGADLSAAVAVEVLIQPGIGVEKMVVVRLVVTGVLVHSSPGDEKESWSVGRQADWLAWPGLAQAALSYYLIRVDWLEQSPPALTPSM